MILPPLLHGSAAGGTLRTEWRRIEDKLQKRIHRESHGGDQP